MSFDLRFTLYRQVIANFIMLNFKTHKITPLGAAVDAKIEYVTHDSVFPELSLPGVMVATTFLPTDGAEQRSKKIALQTKLRALLMRLAPKSTPPIPTTEAAFLDAVYPGGFRRAWPKPPALPPELRDNPDPIATLATRGPFAWYLRAATAEEVAAGEAGEGDYVIDLSSWLKHPVLPGLVRPGGKAVLSVGTDGKLSTKTIHRDDDVSADIARRALLAGLNEHLTTFRHNIGQHNVMLTDVAIATINQLSARHPIRRLLQHCFHTLLIGNRENATAQLSGPTGFSSTTFSHDAPQVSAIAQEYLAGYDFFDYAPDVHFAAQGTTETPFAYPHRDNLMELWAATLDYVTDYVALYYDDDAAVQADPALQAWADELDRLVPNGVPRGDGGITRDWVVRVCATVIHVSTVDHDIANNIVWDYATFNWIVPTAVPASGEHQDQLRSLDFIATLIGTWRPFNMLFTANVPALAIDERGRNAMIAWLDRLGEIQKQMEARGYDPSLSYPANLNVSVTN